MSLHRHDRNTTKYAGVPHLVNLTHTSFVTNWSLARTGILISGGTNISSVFAPWLLSLGQFPAIAISLNRSRVDVVK